MPKNIVLLSDGTGNSAAKVWRTNVWRTYQALKLSNGKEQIAQYDDGVGTSTFKPLALLGGAFGFGLKRNVLRLYKFISANYEEGDKIYCFGFSRGAYTIRVVTSLIATQGLVPRNLTGPDFDRRALDKYRAYRMDRFKGFAGDGWSFQLVSFWRELRNALIYFKRKSLKQLLPDYWPAKTPPHIAFLGVWDTVAAYGLPVQEMTRGIDLWFWPIAPTDRVLHENIQRGCHAIAIDDERTTFHPLLWTETIPDKPKETAELRKRLSQVWFTGMHSNVGGGYPDDSLSYISLDWMMAQAERAGIVFASGARAEINEAAKKAKLKLSMPEQGDREPVIPNGKIHDSRAGSGAYYRYGPRHITNICNFYEKRDPRDNVSIDVPKIHYSVFERIRNGGDSYAPIGLPGRYAVVKENGSVVQPSSNLYEHETQASDRFNRQEVVWNSVWRRRVLYFVTLFFAVFILVRPFLPSSGFFFFFDFLNVLYLVFRSLGGLLNPVFAIFEPVISGLLTISSILLPSFVADWLRMLASDRGPFLAQLLLLGVLMWRSSFLKSEVRTTMRELWSHLQAKPVRVRVSPRPKDRLTRLRHWERYKNFHRRMRRWIIPGVFGVFVLCLFGYSALIIYARSFTTFVAVTGQVCVEGQRLKDNLSQIAFSTDNPCWPSNREAEAGKRYCVRMQISENWPWKDGGVPSGLEGISIAKSNWVQILGIPFRRQVFQPYFRPIVRISGWGDDEYALTPPSGQASAATLNELYAEITPRTSGELFVFVNDVLLPWPFPQKKLYDNNDGRALFLVWKLGDNERCEKPEQK